jgi:hypothetical protein
MAIWTVYAEYDAVAGVWFARASDMPGLHVDAPTIDALAGKAGGMILDLLEINEDLLDDEAKSGPHSIRIVAHDDRAFPVAA